MRRSRDKALPPEGLWIAPDGKRWVPVVEHLATLAEYPQYFDLSPRDVKGASIDDLRALANEIIRDGWTRFRVLDDVMHVEVNNLRQKISVIDAVLVEVGAGLKDRVIISQSSPRREFECKAADVFDRVVERFSETNPRKNRWRFS